LLGKELDIVILRIKNLYQSLLVGLVMIDVEFGREYHSSIPATAIKRELDIRNFYDNDKLIIMLL
jgi:hypothetical protein